MLECFDLTFCYGFLIELKVNITFKKLITHGRIWLGWFLKENKGQKRKWRK